MRLPFRAPKPGEGGAPADHPPRPGRSMLARAGIGALLIFVLTTASVASAVLLEVNDAVQIFRRESKPLDPGVKELLANVQPGKPQTILVIGDDRRYDEVYDRKGNLLKHPARSRSDTMILIHLDPSKGATAIMSLPRDLRTDIPGYGRAKLNAAYSYGGDKLAIKTIGGLLGLRIHHYVRVTFWGFRDAIDRLGCVYSDVDRRYSHSNLGLAPAQQYAEINVKAGYQKLCGQKALDYVRYRHGDSDLVREVRQQQFISDARSQVGVGSLFRNRTQLLRIFGRAVRTDISSTKSILGLLKLVAESSGKPLQPVRLQVTDATDGSGDVEATPGAIRAAAQRFLDVQASPGAKGAARRTGRKARRSRRNRNRRASVTVPAGLYVNAKPGEDIAARLSVKLGTKLPVYYPKLLTSSGNFRADDGRPYAIRDRSGKLHKAYRIVAYEGHVGQYFGVQGTTWQSPPVLDDPSETRTVRGRRLQLYYDGSRLRLVAWKTAKAWYWVENTLLRSLSEKQMLAVARSLTRVGS